MEPLTAFPVAPPETRAGCSFEGLMCEIIDEVDGYRGWQPSAEQVADLEGRLREAWEAWRSDVLHRAA
jgi:hypothetical protein